MLIELGQADTEEQRGDMHRILCVRGAWTIRQMKERLSEAGEVEFA